MSRILKPFTLIVDILTNLELPPGVNLELFLEIIGAQFSPIILRDLHHVGIALSPREDVGMMVERPDKYDRPALGWVHGQELAK